MYVYVYIIVYVYIYILLMVMKVTYYEISIEKNPISVFHPLRPDLPALPGHAHHLRSTAWRNPRICPPGNNMKQRPRHVQI